MSLQRQHFLLSYLKNLSVGAAGVRTRDLPLSRPALSQLSQSGGGVNIYVAGKCPGSPFLYFLDPPLISTEMLDEELSFCGCATAKSLFIHLFFFLSIRGDLMIFIDFLDCLFVY